MREARKRAPPWRAFKMTQRREKINLTRIVADPETRSNGPRPSHEFCRLCPNPRRGDSSVAVEPPGIAGGGPPCRPDQQEATLRDPDCKRGGGVLGRYRGMISVWRRSTTCQTLKCCSSWSYRALHAMPYTAPCSSGSS